MKRLVLACISALFFTTAPSLSAQKANIGINGAVALPFGDFSDFVDLGFGGDVTFDYYFNDKFDLGIEVGYRTFAFDEALGGGSYNIIPLQLTAGYHTDIDDWIDFYAELGGGAYIVSLSEGTDSETYGGISPRVGAAFELNDLLFLDANVSYTSIFVDGPGGAPNWLGVNVGLLYTVWE